MPHPQPDFLPRLLAGPLLHSAETSPVVIVTGARQTGKTTLVRSALAERGYDYLTLDDPDLLGQARAAPDEVILRSRHLIIDEVQRSPDLLGAVKRAVDERREAGAFILTGSANLLLLHRVSETLAGRAVYLTLWPFTRLELLGMGETGAWSAFFEQPRSSWADIVKARLGPPQEWTELVQRGGYPTPAYHLSSTEDRTRWFASYAATYLERDVRSLAAIEHLADFRRLMRVCCLRLGNLMNQADIARDVGIAPTTAQRYLNVLEASYQLVRLPAYAVNRTKRLTKAPKLYWSDTALALQLAGESQARGAHLENLVVCDLLAWRDAQVRRPEILYWRTSKGAEVDFVIERGQELLAIEVKASPKVAYGDIRHLHTFLHEYEGAVRGALVLYTGDDVFWLSRDILAAPWWLAV